MPQSQHFESTAANATKVSQTPIQYRTIPAGLEELEDGSRDRRIDFFRGLALYMIFVDHVIGDPLSKFTFRSIGFSDASEIFVFISGLACGIAYSRSARQSLSALFSSIAKRAGRIYIYYALSSGAIILLMTAAAVFLKIDYEVLAGALSLGLEQHLTIWSALLLISPPPGSSILLLYIVLTLVNVPAFMIAGERHCVLVLATSALIWAGSQVFSGFLALSFDFFNLFAWQFLFSIGIFVGVKWNSNQPILPSLAQLGWVVVMAWTIVISAFLYRLVSSRSGLDVAWLRIAPGTWDDMKANLSAIRLLHFLSVAFLVAIYFRRDSALFKWSISMPVINAGRHSLQVFSLIVVLDTVVNIVVLVGSPSLLSRLLMDSIAFLFMALLAIALVHRRTVRVTQR
jgi:hypothetical protein